MKDLVIAKANGENMKKILLVGLTALILTGCGAKTMTPDVTVVELEKMLNDGEVVTGKIVEITVDDYAPASAFGYNMMTGEHLNFVSTSNPEVKIGDTLIVKVGEVQSMLGSFIIQYTK